MQTCNGHLPHCRRLFIYAVRIDLSIMSIKNCIELVVEKTNVFVTKRPNKKRNEIKLKTNARNRKTVHNSQSQTNSINIDGM